MNAVGGRSLRSANASPRSISLADKYPNARRMRIHTVGFLMKDSMVEKYVETRKAMEAKGVTETEIMVTTRDAIRQSFCSA